MAAFTQGEEYLRDWLQKWASRERVRGYSIAQSDDAEPSQRIGSILRSEYNSGTKVVSDIIPGIALPVKKTAPFGAEPGYKEDRAKKQPYYKPLRPKNDLRIDKPPQTMIPFMNTHTLLEVSWLKRYLPPDFKQLGVPSYRLYLHDVVMFSEGDIAPMQNAVYEWLCGHVAQFAAQHMVSVHALIGCRDIGEYVPVDIIAYCRGGRNRQFVDAKNSAGVSLRTFLVDRNAARRSIDAYIRPRFL